MAKSGVRGHMRRGRDTGEDKVTSKAMDSELLLRRVMFFLWSSYHGAKVHPEYWVELASVSAYYSACVSI